MTGSSYGGMKTDCTQEGQWKKYNEIYVMKCMGGLKLAACESNSCLRHFVWPAFLPQGDPVFEVEFWSATGWILECGFLRIQKAGCTTSSYKELEHLWILVSTRSCGTNPPLTSILQEIDKFLCQDFMPPLSSYPISYLDFTNSTFPA